MGKKIILISFFFCLSASGAQINNFQIDSKFFQALGKVESNNNDKAIGDNGKAISRYQIWRACYQDAREFDKSINFSYESLTNKVNAEKIVTAYLNRYCPKACKNNDFQTMARIFNGGPNGAKKQATLKYWKKIKINLDK